MELQADSLLAVITGLIRIIEFYLERKELYSLEMIIIFKETDV